MPPKRRASGKKASPLALPEFKDTAKGELERRINEKFTFEPFSPPEVHLILWYWCTTNLANSTIAEIVRLHFPFRRGPAAITEIAVADIVHYYTIRAEMGLGVRDQQDSDLVLLEKPEGFGTAPCDHGIDCISVKRTAKVLANERAANIARGLWQGTFKQLLKCPRGHTIHSRIEKVQARPANHLYYFSRRTASKYIEDLAVSVIQSIADITFMLSMTLTMGCWFLSLNFFCTPAAQLASSPYAQTVSCVAHTYYGLPLGVAVTKVGIDVLLGLPLLLTPECMDPGNWTRFYRKMLVDLVTITAGALVSLWLLSWLGVLGHWKSLSHPVAECEWVGHKNHWTAFGVQVDNVVEFFSRLNMTPFAELELYAITGLNWRG